MAGPGMPAVQQTTPIDALAAFEDITTSSILTSFQRAYAGGGWSTIAAGTRTIDMQRTAAVHFEKTTILGHERLVGLPDGEEASDARLVLHDSGCIHTRVSIRR